MPHTRSLPPHSIIYSNQPEVLIRDSHSNQRRPAIEHTHRHSSLSTWKALTFSSRRKIAHTLFHCGENRCNAINNIFIAHERWSGGTDYVCASHAQNVYMCAMHNECLFTNTFNRQVSRRADENKLDWRARVEITF